MKKLIISSVTVLALAMMFTGCGGGSASDGSADTATGNSGNSGSTPGVVSPGVDATEAAITTPETPYNISSKLGTPPGLPE